MQDANLNQESELDERDFQRVRSLLYAWGGISLKDSKRSLVFNRLIKRLRIYGMVRFADYLDLAEHDAGEREQFVNALTTNLTAFFRESHHFEALAAYLQTLPDTRPVTIWSSAASTGEEPYSIAITVLETLGASASGRVRIVASDLDTRVLAHARAGIYRLDQLACLSEARKRQYFLKGIGQREGLARVRPELQNLIEFRQINLLAEQWPHSGALDVIFCRNVMIYFDKATQLRVLEKFAPLLAADGLLLVGHSESLSHASHLFRLCGRTQYRKNSGGGDE